MIFNELSSRPTEEKLQNIVESWWNVYEHNSRLALEKLAVVLFNSAGIKTDKFDISEFLDKSHKEQIFSKNTNMPNIPLSNKYFAITLKQFMDQLFQKNCWALLQNESFINKFLAVIEVMKVSSWDSWRAVSFLTGMKILRHSYNYLMASHSNKIAKARIDTLWNEVHRCVFRYSFRDKSPYLRSIPLMELISWSKETPEIIINHNISKYILRGLKDSSIGNCKYSLILCYTVFMKPLIIKKQQELFESLIPELIIFVTMNEDLAVLSFKIVNLALGFLIAKIGAYEDMNFSMCLYDERESVVEEAKLYFYSTHLKNKSGVDIIVETFRFYKKCCVKNVSKLVHGLVTYFAVHTSWQDWEYCLKFLDNFCDYLKLLYEYIYIINKESGNSMKGLDSSAIHKMKNEFSVFWNENLIKLLDSDKAIIKSNDQVSVLKLTTLCDVSKLHKKAHTEIINKLMNIFHQSQSFEVLKECLLTLQFFNSYNKNAEIEENFVSRIIMELIEILNSEHEETCLLNVIQYKVILLVKNIQHDYEATWASLVCLLEGNTNFQKIGVIISVLYHLLMKILKIYIKFISGPETDNDSVNVEENRFQGFILESRLFNWSSTVIKTASAFIENIHHFNDDYNFLVIPRLYGELIHLSKKEFLSGFSFKFTDKEIESYIICCTKTMPLDCRRNGAELCPCCLLLRDYVKFTIDGNISVIYLKYFIMNLIKINSHALIIMDMLNYLIKVELGSVVALVLTNGLICIYNKRKEKGDNAETIKENLNEIITFILKNLDDMEGKNCQKTGLHLHLYLKKLISDGYNIFSNISEIIKSTLCEKIINKLLDEN